MKIRSILSQKVPKLLIFSIMINMVQMMVYGLAVVRSLKPEDFVKGTFSPDILELDIDVHVGQSHYLRHQLANIQHSSYPI